MSKNMDYIIYINSFVDHERYHSYSDVQAAIARGELFPDPPEYRPKYVCKFCGKEIIKVNPFDSSEFCNASCSGKWTYRSLHKDRVIKEQKPSHLIVRRASEHRSNKYHERIVAILPYYNEGFSDRHIGEILGLSDKYIANIRHMFKVPANYGQPPEEKIDPTKI